MYKKVDADRTSAEFWKTLGQYMAQVPSASEQKANWLNYDTGVKGLDFKVKADNGFAEIAVEFTNHFLMTADELFTKMINLRPLFEEAVGEWFWDETNQRISLRMNGFQTYRKEDWPPLISFFKEQLQALDRFWSDAQFYFLAH